MLASHHRFSIVVTDHGGAVLRRAPFDDFEPCYEDLLFSAVASGRVPNDGRLPFARLAPVWADEDMRRVAGVWVTLPPIGKGYDLRLFAEKVREIRTLEARSEKEENRAELADYGWHVEAEPVEAHPQAARRTMLQLSVSREPYPISPRSLESFGLEPGVGEAGSVYIARALMDELLADTGRSLDTERADILSGHLVRRDEGATALVVTGRVPAVGEASASRAHFAFSPWTFLVAQREIARAGNGAAIAGWHHTHPPPCQEKCLRYLPPCQSATVFFSLDDGRVHRASFAAPYMVGLVSGKAAGKRADQPVMRAYGWQDGTIREKNLVPF